MSVSRGALLDFINITAHSKSLPPKYFFMFLTFSSKKMSSLCDKQPHTNYFKSHKVLATTLSFKMAGFRTTRTTWKLMEMLYIIHSNIPARLGLFISGLWRCGETHKETRWWQTHWNLTTCAWITWDMCKDKVKKTHMPPVLMVQREWDSRYYQERKKNHYIISLKPVSLR